MRLLILAGDLDGEFTHAFGEGAFHMGRPGGGEGQLGQVAGQAEQDALADFLGDDTWRDGADAQAIQGHAHDGPQGA